MKQCPVCNYEHRRFIEYFLTKRPFDIKRISFFYEIPVNDLEYHMKHCMSRLKPTESIIEPVQGATANGT